MLSSRRRTRTLGRAVVAAATLALLAPVGITTSSAKPAPTTADRQLRVMEFNIEDGGVIVHFPSIVEALRLANPDVVGIEEAQGNLPRLASAAGFPYYSVRLQILSQYPIIDPPNSHGRFVYIEVEPGKVVAIGNVHLPSNPYSPGYIKRGATRATALHFERHLRLPAIKPPVRSLSTVVAAGIPTFLTGDFNSPSFHDWTQATVGPSGHPYVVRWPVTEYVERNGFHDSYRTVYPDPVANPGITWPSARPHEHGVWNPGPTSPRDRIDLIFSAGAARPVASVIIGDKEDPAASITVDPWGTDHESVMSTFVVQPQVPPTLVAVSDRLVTRGQTERVTYHAPSGGSDRVVVTWAGQTVASRGTAGATDGTVDLSTRGWAPGAYDATLMNGDTSLSTNRFWVEAPGTLPSLHASAQVYAVGAPIQVTWSDAPGERWDWVAAYHRGADPLVASYLTWQYTHASIAGAATLTAKSQGPWPLPAGRYSLYLLADDGYAILARADLTVR